VTAVRLSDLERPIVRVDQPLVLISQAQRSGGTLLLRLFDGHPECQVAPFQLRGIDQAAKHSLTDPEEAWRALYDPKLAVRFEEGHRQRKRDVLDEAEVFAFELEPDLQRSIYESCVARLAKRTARGLFDCYFTSYFNAWLDYRNLETAPKRWVVGFEPGVARSMRRRGALQETYPDGRVISLVRDPWSWYASARRWEPRWRGREAALDHWLEAAGGVQKWRNKNTKREMRLIRFDRLVMHTEEMMSRLASWLEIDFVPALLAPTFNGRPIRGNSSFADVTKAVSVAPLDRARRELGRDDVDYIDRRAGELYEELLERANREFGHKWGGRKED
jgi:sulfotransferase family protein